MLQKKICMLGAFGVGKTSLVRRLVDGVFSDTYLTTIGVKVDRYQTRVNGRVLNMIVWDIQGEESDRPIVSAYLRGGAGFILVADVTQPDTILTAKHLYASSDASYRAKPWIWALNKSDLLNSVPSVESLRERYELPDDAMVVLTSAKEDLKVAELFHSLAGALVPA